jgi:hypothetical protein
MLLVVLMANLHAIASVGCPVFVSTYPTLAEKNLRYRFLWMPADANPVSY